MYFGCKSIILKLAYDVTVTILLVDIFAVWTAAQATGSQFQVYDQAQHKAPSQGFINISEGEKSTYRPSDGNTLFDHRAAEVQSVSNFYPHEILKVVTSADVKCIVNDVAFLTRKSRDGNKVVYIGNNIGRGLLIIAKMFPKLKFLVYDGNNSKLMEAKRNEPGQVFPPNLHLKSHWFSTQEAERITEQRFPQYDHMQTLLITNSINQVWDRNRHVPIFRDVESDMHNQKAWVEILKPRSACLKFDFPFFYDEDAERYYSYLSGELHFQVSKVFESTIDQQESLKVLQESCQSMVFEQQ